MKKNDSVGKRGLWAIMAPVNVQIRAAMLLAAFGAFAGVINLYLMAVAVGGLFNSVAPAPFGYEVELRLLLIIILIVSVLSFMTRFSGFIVSHLGAFRLEEVLRTDISRHLARVPLGYITNMGAGALKKVMMDDVKDLHVFVADSTPFLGKSIAAPIVSLIIMFFIDWRLALAGISVLFVGVVVMSFAMRDSAEQRRKYDESNEKINAAVIEFVQAMPVVRTFDVGTGSFKRYTESLEEFKTAMKDWVRFSGTPGRIGMVVLSPAPTILVVTLVGIILVKGGSLDITSFIAGLMISTGMADSLMPLMFLNSFIKKSAVGANRIQEIMEVAELNVTDEPEVPSDASVFFDNVSFKYENRDAYALENVSFDVPQGTVTAVVGPSGAGKSTVARLIPRFWDVDEGSVKVGGVDVRNVLPETLMDNVSFVFQDTFLFNDTIANNIKMANTDATFEEVKRAAETAQIHDFISSLPDGYNTMAGDRGVRVSGGQRQRITIARAILRNAPIVVLDEATAFADPENEEEIIKAVANLMRGKTVIIIAHRLSTIKSVNQIVVFDEGKINEKGSHEELIANGGLYASLWKNHEKAQSWHMKKQGDSNEL